MYQLYLSSFLFPVAPEKLTLKIDNRNETVELIGDGVVSILKQPGLTKVTFSALLPNVRYPFAAYESDFQPASWYLTALEQIKLSAKPVDFRLLRTASGLSWQTSDTTLRVSLEDYTISEDAAQYGGDVMVDVTLLQYRAWATKTLEITKTALGGAAAAITTPRDTSGRETPQSYTVQAGDNLWNLAKKYLGDGSKSDQLYESNRETIEQAARQNGRASSSNGWWIYPGTVLKLPEGS